MDGNYLDLLSPEKPVFKKRRKRKNSEDSDPEFGVKGIPTGRKRGRKRKRKDSDSDPDFDSFHQGRDSDDSCASPIPPPPPKKLPSPQVCVH